jgi:hypothetical protein
MVAIICIYLLATNFSLSINTTVPQNDPVVLIDHSQSMKNHLPHILGKISKTTFPHELCFFQEKQILKAKPDNLGEYTDITTALRRTAELNPAALILITDGNHNYGASPLSVTTELNVPVEIYGIGEDKPRDVSIADIAYPAYAFQGDTIEIRVIVESGAFQTGGGEATLRFPSGKKIATQGFPLSNTPALYAVDFVHIPPEPGQIHLTVDLTPQADEISYVNNRTSFSINILPNKITVLYYTDHISFNTKYIMRSLLKDRHLSVTTIHGLAPGRFQDFQQNKTSNSPPDHNEYDVVILDNVNLGRLHWLPVNQIADGGPGVILCGVLEGINPVWKGIMPIDVTAGILQGTYQLTITEPFSVLTDNEYPPLQRVSRIVGSKQDAVVIARTGAIPLIAYRKYGRSRIFQVSIINLGTWHFLQRGLQEQDFLYYFLGDMIRFVSLLGEHERLVLETQPGEYAIGESVDLTLKSYDRNLRPIGGGDFFLVAEEERIPFYEIKEGYYEASFVAQEKGEFEIFAQGQIDEEQLASNTAMINVSSRQIETEHRINRALLERIATATDGKFVSLKDCEQLAAPEIRKIQVSEVISFNSPILYIIILGLTIADWIIRRRKGIT